MVKKFFLRSFWFLLENEFSDYIKKYGWIALGSYQRRWYDILRFGISYEVESVELANGLDTEISRKKKKRHQGPKCLELLCGVDGWIPAQAVPKYRKIIQI